MAFTLDNIMIVFLFLDLSVMVNDMHTMKQDVAHLTDLLNDHMKTGMYYFVAFRTFRYCIVIVRD